MLFSTAFLSYLFYKKNDNSLLTWKWGLALCLVVMLQKRALPKLLQKSNYLRQQLPLKGNWGLEKKTFFYFIAHSMTVYLFIRKKNFQEIFNIYLLRYKHLKILIFEFKVHFLRSLVLNYDKLIIGLGVYKVSYIPQTFSTEWLCSGTIF